TDAEARLQARLAAARQALADQRQAREEELARRERLQEELAQLRQERSAVTSRVEILQRLIRSHEGLSVGVREVFPMLEQPGPGPWRTVLGMVGDFLTVRREYAPLIALALGDASQRFIVRDVELLRQGLAERPEPFSGRVSFMPLAQPGDDALR